MPWWCLWFTRGTELAANPRNADDTAAPSRTQGLVAGMVAQAAHFRTSGRRAGHGLFTAWRRSMVELRWYLRTVLALAMFVPLAGCGGSSESTEPQVTASING